jgi:hypothetical protein
MASIQYYSWNYGAVYTPGSSGSGTWVWTMDLVDYGYANTALVVDAGVFRNGTAGSNTPAGVMKINGTTVIPDMSVTSEVFGFPLDLGWGVQTITMAVTGAAWTSGDTWDFPYLVYTATFPNSIDNVYWVNPATQQFLKSSDEAFLARANKKVTAAGDWTLADQNGFYHLWGGQAQQTITRFRQRDDGLGNYDGTPPRIDIRSGSQQVSTRLPGNNTYR